MREKKLLDYHDVLLYQQDVDLLLYGRWLNDQVPFFADKFVISFLVKCVVQH